MSTTETISERVIGVVRMEIGATTPAMTDDLVEDLGADSLDMVELVMGIEEEFSIQIPDEDVDGWKTVGDVVAYVEGHFSPERR